MKSTLFSARQMEQEDIMLNEVSQTRKSLYHRWKLKTINTEIQEGILQTKSAPGWERGRKKEIGFGMCLQHAGVDREHWTSLNAY